MTDEGSVSVVIPCYNSSRFIGAAVESVLEQTYSPIEILVVNDGSTDDFYHTLKPYLKDIKILNQKNSGQAVARNYGIDESQSEFIAFLDADDLWTPDKIEKQISLFEQHPDCGLVYSDRIDIDVHGNILEKPCYDPPSFPSGLKRHLADLALRNYIPMSSVLIRRKALGAERFSPEFVPCEDWDMWLRISSHSDFGYIKEPLIFYRLHDNNSSSNLHRMWISMIGVMSGVLERESNKEVRRRAISTQKKWLTQVGHLEYELGKYQVARKYFKAAMPVNDAVAIGRYAATYIPELILSPMRSTWRTIHRNRQAKLKP